MDTSINNNMDHNLFDLNHHNHLPPKMGVFVGSILAVLNYFFGWLNYLHPIKEYNILQQFCINIVQALFVGGVGAIGAWLVKKIIAKYDKKQKSE